MRLVPRLFRRKESPSASVTTSYDLLNLLAAQVWQSAAGIEVTYDEALKCPAVAASAKVLSETVAQLPFNILFVGQDGKKEVVKSNPVHKLLSTGGRPNGWQTSFDFRRWATRRVVLRGNAYALKQRVSGSLDALIPIVRPVTVEQNDLGELIYKVSTKSGQRVIYGQDDIFHLRGESDDSITGIDPIKQNAEAIGLALAQDRFASKMFSNGVRLSGVLEFPSMMSEEAHKRLKESFEQQYGSVENAHRVLILENGAKFNQVSMTLDEAQLLDSRKLQRSIIASLFRVPPHMIGDLDKATFSNIEDMARQFIDYGFAPWIDMWQQSTEQQLLTRSQRVSHIAKLNVNGLLRGNAAQRSAFYNAGITGTWLSPNEVRDKEDMNPREGGDAFINPNINPGKQDEPTQGNPGDGTAEKSV